MSQLQHTANYAALNSASSIDASIQILTTAQVAAATAEQKNSFGTVYLVSATGLPPYNIYLATGSAITSLASLLGNVTVTGGTINGTTVGATTRATGAFTSLAVTGVDSSGTPGSVTNSNGSGRAAIAAGANTMTVTNTLVAAADHVLIVPRQIDATATAFAVTPGAGSFTVSTNANATANWAFDFFVVKN